MIDCFDVSHPFKPKNSTKQAKEDLLPYDEKLTFERANTMRSRKRCLKYNRNRSFLKKRWRPIAEAVTK